jgi:co-chaperonin GroES (HSP10)
MPYMVMSHDIEPKKKILDEIGDLSTFELFNNQVLVAVYIRPNRTKSGIYLSDQTTDEDKYQSKVGLVLKRGPSAFDASVEDDWFKDMAINDGDWVVFRPSDGWGITVHNVMCRVLVDTAIKGRVVTPDEVW